MFHYEELLNKFSFMQRLLKFLVKQTTETTSCTCIRMETSLELRYSATDKADISAPSSEFVSSSIPSWHILTAHAQPFRGASDLAFCLKVPLDSLLVWASSGGSGETARMRRLAWTFAALIGDKYQIRLTWSIWWYHKNNEPHHAKTCLRVFLTR